MTANSDSSADLWVDWDRYHRLIEELCIQLDASDWRFDHVLCLARGGLRVGDVVSRLFRLPLAVLATSSYRDEGGSVQGDLAIAASITTTGGPLRGNVLLVDDLVDSGVTLSQVRQRLMAENKDIAEVRSAVLWWKAQSVVEPDYFVERLAHNPWIHQPFETYDTMSLDELSQR